MKFITFKNTAADDAEKLKRSTKASREASFEKRRAEIESLRQYDRGEKEITPRNLTDLVRGL